MTIATPVRSLPPRLREHIQQKQRDAANFREIVLMAIDDLGFPAAAIEIKAHLNSELDKDYSLERVRYALSALLDTRTIFSRPETHAERSLRFVDGRKPLGHCADLYSISNPVPERTQAAVPGTEMTGPTKKRGPNKNTKKRTPVAASVPQSQQASTQDALDFLIGKLVEERTQEIQAKLTAAEAKLAKLRALL
jgi:hypothetical protein